MPSRGEHPVASPQIVPWRFRLRVLVALASVLGAICYGLLLPSYPGHGLVLLAYVATATLVGACAVVLRPSFFIVITALFVTLGFTVKLVAHLTFGADLIEPVGRFAGTGPQWDVALTYATAGHLGFAVAIILARRFPSQYPRRSRDLTSGPARTRVLTASLVILLVIAAAVYTANYRYHILRIGYPSSIDLGVPAYLAASFIISWGALLGALALTYWLVETRRLPPWTLFVVPIFLGFASSVTMGSRSQYLLYVLAVCVVLVARRDLIGSRRGVVVSLGAAAVMFVVTLGVVSLQRDAVFTPTSGTGSSSSRPASEARDVTLSEMFDVAQNDQRLARMLNEIRSLVVMRWIGLEGVLTTASEPDVLDRDTLVRALTESPAAGTDGLYQRLSHSTYDQAQGFTFLTLPGLMGVGSLSGSLPIIFAFVLLSILALHAFEVLAGMLTGNVAIRAVCGVSLAYLTTQMGFPWTLLVFVVELLIAVAVLAVCWTALRRLTS